VNPKDLAALEQLRKMRLDRAESELAAVRIAMREADLKLRQAETETRIKQTEATSARNRLALLQPSSILDIMDGRQAIDQADEEVDTATETMEQCHSDRFVLLDKQSQRREDWNTRKRALDRWHHLQEGLLDEEEQKTLRREDAEEINRQQNMILNQRG
jgi:hypothetical protein